MINPEKIPYNLSEVILWTLENGNTIRTMEAGGVPGAWRSSIQGSNPIAKIDFHMKILQKENSKIY